MNTYHPYECGITDIIHRAQIGGWALAYRAMTSKPYKFFVDNKDKFMNKNELLGSKNHNSEVRIIWKYKLISMHQNWIVFKKRTFDCTLITPFLDRHNVIPVSCSYPFANFCERKIHLPPFFHFSFCIVSICSFYFRFPVPIRFLIQFFLSNPSHQLIVELCASPFWQFYFIKLFANLFSLL